MNRVDVKISKIDAQIVAPRYDMNVHSYNIHTVNVPRRYYISGIFF